MNASDHYVKAIRRSSHCQSLQRWFSTFCKIFTEEEMHFSLTNRQFRKWLWSFKTDWRRSYRFFFKTFSSALSLSLKSCRFKYFMIWRCPLMIILLSISHVWKSCCGNEAGGLCLLSGWEGRDHCEEGPSQWRTWHCGKGGPDLYFQYRNARGHTNATD